MSINDKKLEEVLKPEYVETYKSLHNDIWGRLLHIHTNIIILDRLSKFDFDTFCPVEQTFWYLVHWNFMCTSIILINGLINDQGSGKHTLPRFRNKVLKWLKESEKKNYQQNLKRNKLDKNLVSIRRTIKDLRRNRVAHRLLDDHGLKVKNAKGVSLAEIKNVYEDIEKLFCSCSFGGQYITTFYSNSTVGGQPIEKDIDKLLDMIEKNSDWLNEPEINQFWPMLRKHKPKKEIDELNSYRKKFGMPEV